MQLFAVAVTHKFNYEWKGFWQTMVRANNRLFTYYAVDPSRWGAVIADISEYYPQATGTMLDFAHVLMDIYRTVPPLFSGALDVLTAFKQTGIKTALVTHASEEWTTMKLKTHGIGGIFDFVHIVDTSRHKGSEDWEIPLKRLGVEPSSAMVIGDSLPGDIRASRTAGVQNQIYLPSQWTIYNSGDIPAGTIKVVGGIGNLIPTLLKN